VLFRDTEWKSSLPNQLVLHGQPEEGIALRFAAKTRPIAPGNGEGINTPTTSASSPHADACCTIAWWATPLFQRADMVEAGWSVVSPMLDL
jgi:glucose-6-phosphate 1-dehydrogenase